MASWQEAVLAVVGQERFSAEKAALEAASVDESTLPASLPEAVCWPVSTDEVARLVAAAREYRFALTARGAGTSLAGNPIPLAGGLVVDFSQMNRIVEVRPEDLLVRVEPGVVYDDLNHHVRDHGLFFPPSPGGSHESATIGGMVGNDASGIYALRYGATRDAVLGLTAVTGTGEIVSFGHDCRKSSSGYALERLLVGSEGTLALVTEVTLRLSGLPEGRRFLGYGFPGDEAASRCVAQLVAGGSDLAAIEYLDAAVMRALARSLSEDLPESPILLFEAHGSAPRLDETIELTTSICEAEGGRPLPDAVRRDPWRLREKATASVRQHRPGARILRTDLSIPIGSLPEIVARAHELAAEARVDAFVFGHAGYGIVHALLVADGGDADEWARATTAKDRLVEAVLDRRGSVSGEHGLGFGNRGFAERELGAALALMKGIKHVFDPDGILNPGKIWTPNGGRAA